MAVDPAVVRATQEQLRKDGHEGLASVIELLRWTACRPSEVCTITAGDLYETDEGLGKPQDQEAHGHRAGDS